MRVLVLLGVLLLGWMQWEANEGMQSESGMPADTAPDENNPHPVPEGPIPR